MARINLLRDADICAISIVGKGANRKRFFLRKEQAGDENLITMPSSGRLLKAEDWSVVYCVVAEPGWQEDPGIGAPDQSIPDEWASEDEIRKAAHRFSRNGGLITKLHQGLAPYGNLVENAVALADFTVEGETIRKGSWYVAIEPTEEGKAAIEAGEFTGVSIDGLAVRELVEKEGEDVALPDGIDFTGCLHVIDQLITMESLGSSVSKAEEFTKPGIANVSGEDLKKLEPLIRYYEGQPHFFGACKRDQLKHGVSEDHANRRCAVLKQLSGRSTKKASADESRKVSRVTKILDRIARAVGVPEEELAELAKGQPATFAARMAEREFDDELPDAWDALRSAVYSAFYQASDGDYDPIALINTSLDEFKAWAMDLLEGTPAAVAKLATQVEQAEADHKLITAAVESAGALADRSALVKRALAKALGEADEVSRAAVEAILADPEKWLTEHDVAVRKATKTTDAPWDGSASRFTDEQYRRACILDRGSGAGTAKQRYSLPIREPNGTLNVNALGSALGRVTQVQGASSEQIATAKRKLAAAYRAAGKEVPAKLAKFAPVVSNDDAGNVADMELSERVEKIEGELEKLPETITAAITKALDEREPAKPDPEKNGEPVTKTDKPDPEKNDEPAADDRIEKLTKAVDDLTQTVQAMGEGRSTQLTEEQRVEKADRTLKAYESAGLDHNLAGIL